MNGTQSKPTPPDWWADTIDCWHRLPNKVFFFPLLAVWLLLFQFWGNSILGYYHSSSLFGWLYYVYNIGGDDKGTDDSYGDIIPFLVVGLFWWKRKELLALPLKLWWPGLVMLALAGVLHVAGFLLQEPFVSIVALFAGMAWGREWLRHSIYPFSLFIFSIPMTAHLNFILFPLRLFVCWLVEMVSHLIGIGVIRQGTQLLDPLGNYGYDVAAACGGMRSLIAIFLLATVFAFGTFRSPWKRFFLMASALPFAILGNMARLLCIIVAAEMGGQKWGDYVHEGGPFGIISLLPYVPAIVGLLVAGRLMEKSAENKRA